jgi:hypothetical protein
MFDFQRVSQQYLEEYDALRFEVHKLAELFHDNAFFGDPGNFRHAHYGYLMACMGRVDQYSALWQGTILGDRSDQTQRMIDFLATFVYPLSSHERVHSVVVKMFRHSLMHTGVLRFAFDRGEGVGYTWRVHFGKLPDGLDHYSITTVDPHYQDQLLRAPLPEGCALKEIRSINISIPLLVTGLYQGISRYMHQLRVSEDLQRKYLATEAEMTLQLFKHRLPNSTPLPVASA